MAYSREKAARVITFINELKHTKGIWAGNKFNLRPWQRKILRELFGRLNADGYRQYRTCYIEIPRKNGKTELAAPIALYLFFADNEPGAEIYCAAGDRDQASLVFNVAAQMIRMSPELSSEAKIIDSQKRIIRPQKGSFLKAISAESRTKYGFNASGIVFDELHVQPNRDLWDVLTTSTGTRTQPLTVAITTAGFDRHSICWELHDYAMKVKDKIIEDPTFLPVIYSAADDDDWTKISTWRKANPALGDFRSLDEMKVAFRKAKEIPAFENTFRRLYLNQWTRQETRFIPMDKWDLCDRTIKPEQLEGHICYGGLDLASTTDIAAFALVFPPEDEEVSDEYVVLPFFWIPEENMHVRSRRDRVPYEMWAEAGLIKATPGNVIDYKYIFETVSELAQLYDIKEIAFDRWGATKIIQEFEERGMLVVQFGQGFKSMSPPTKELLNLVLAGRLVHNNNPVLRWMADNMIVKQDPAGNVKPDKSKSTEKIDGIVATIMALDRALRHREDDEDEHCAYEENDLLVL